MSGFGLVDWNCGGHKGRERGDVDGSYLGWNLGCSQLGNYGGEVLDLVC